MVWLEDFLTFVTHQVVVSILVTFSHTFSLGQKTNAFQCLPYSTCKHNRVCYGKGDGQLKVYVMLIISAHQYGGI